MILFCVRHGESAFNAEGRIQGQTDVSLSDRGRKQAVALASAFKTRTIQAIFASPLARAMETARPVAEALRLPIRTDERLMEIHAGIFQGLRWDEIERSHPAEAARWMAHEPDFVIPEGESRRALMARGRAALEAIRETGLPQVLVIAHGGVLTGAMKALLGVPAERNPFSLFNAAISRIDWGKQFRLITLNETEHLREVNGGRNESGGDL
jgi:probable phosphoglycerate mutase